MNDVNQVTARCARCETSRDVDTVHDAQRWLDGHECDPLGFDGSQL